ncbi:hypothetical protein AOLI_G00202180 [Acnodon oligacanthus]
MLISALINAAAIPSAYSSRSLETLNLPLIHSSLPAIWSGVRLNEARGYVHHKAFLMADCLTVHNWGGQKGNRASFWIGTDAPGHPSATALLPLFTKHLRPINHLPNI